MLSDTVRGVERNGIKECKRLPFLGSFSAFSRSLLFFKSYRFLVFFSN